MHCALGAARCGAGMGRRTSHGSMSSRQAGNYSRLRWTSKDRARVALSGHHAVDGVIASYDRRPRAN
jgi:hypothetical protein